MSNEGEWSLVHDLVREKSNVEDIQALIEKYPPDALKDKYKLGFLPLHIAVTVKEATSVKVVHSCLSKNILMQ